MGSTESATRAVACGMFLLLLATGRGADFEAANALFEAGKFGEAKLRYEQLVEAGEGTANVFYNLGNTDFRLGSAGRAMLNFERALVLEPRHPEARANLALLRAQTGAKQAALSWSERILAGHTLAMWTVVAFAAGWLSIFGVAWLATRRAAAGGWPWLVVVTGIGTALLAGAGVRRGLDDRALALITAQQAEARLAPAESAAVAEALPAGSRVRILSERGAWAYCALPGAGRGWIRQGAWERVIPEGS